MGKSRLPKSEFPPLLFVAIEEERDGTKYFEAGETARDLASLQDSRRVAVYAFSEIVTINTEVSLKTE